MSKFIDITGRRFGRLFVIEPGPRGTAGEVRWRCRCDCGREKIVHGYHLRSGLSTTCGCHGKHPLSKTPTHQSWRGMLDRCTRPKHAHFANYGGRGITVCERWRSFESFLADMGERPAGTTLERINNDKGYEPSNCKWASATEQLNNRGDYNTRLTFGGETLTVAQWARRLGISDPTIRARLRKGWPVDRVLGVVHGK